MKTLLATFIANLIMLSAASQSQAAPFADSNNLLCQQAVGAPIIRKETVSASDRNTIDVYYVCSGGTTLIADTDMKIVLKNFEALNSAHALATETMGTCTEYRRDTHVCSISEIFSADRDAASEGGACHTTIAYQVPCRK